MSVWSSIGSFLTSSTIKGVASGAVKGAIVGGVTAEVTGGDWKEGAKGGALGGAVYGGVSGYLSDPSMGNSVNIGDSSASVKYAGADSQPLPQSSPHQTGGIDTSVAKQPQIQSVKQQDEAGLLDSILGKEGTPQRTEMIGKLISGGVGMYGEAMAAEDAEKQKEIDYERRRGKIQEGVRNELTAQHMTGARLSRI